MADHPMPGPPVSVVIRAKDEAKSIGRTLSILRDQTLPPEEIIVVDSGSRDATPHIAEAAGARLIRIAASDFTFGGALNLGCTAARGEIVVALSAHAFPLDAAWLERLVRPFTDRRVACVTGTDKAPDGSPLRGPLRQDQAHVERHPLWGYSNTAGAFRRELWRARGFRTDLPGVEDKEWAMHWLERGWQAVIDPDVVVDHDHSKDGLADQYRRARLEWTALLMFLDLEPQSLRQALREWWLDRAGRRSRWRARLNPRRMAALAGKYRGNQSRPKRDRQRLAVLVDAFPTLSETFVASEVGALQSQGHHVSVEANCRSRQQDRGPGLDVDLAFLEDDSRPARFTAMVRLAARHPWRATVDLIQRRRWRREEPTRPLRSLSSRAARLNARRIDHLHVHFAAGAALDTMRLARLLGLPYSVTAHAYDIFESPCNLREKLERAAFVTTGCDYNVRYLRERVSAADRIQRVVMGVDGERFQRRVPHPGGRHVLAIGRLVEKKGFAHLIEAVAQLESDEPVDRLTIVGDGVLAADLALQVRRLGLDERVRLVGSRDPEEVRQLLEHADVLAMPCVVARDGDRDSMPVVVKEAMAMELPVVASDEVGLPEIVRPPWGRLVPPADPHALARALRDVLAMSLEQRMEAGRAGRAWVLEHADVDRETARLVEFIRAT